MIAVCVQANQIGKVEKLPLWQCLRKKGLQRLCVLEIFDNISNINY